MNEHADRDRSPVSPHERATWHRGERTCDDCGQVVSQLADDEAGPEFGTSLVSGARSGPESTCCRHNMSDGPWCCTHQHRPVSAPQPPRSATNETGGHSGTGEAQGDAQERVEGLEAELAMYKRGAAELGRILDRSLQDVLDASGMHHVVNEEGDGDWALVWERLAELRPRAEAAEAERDRLAGVVAKVRALHSEPYPSAGWCAGCHDGGRADEHPCATTAILDADPAPEEEQRVTYATGHGFTPSTGPFGGEDGCRVMLAPRYPCPYGKDEHDPTLPPVAAWGMARYAVAGAALAVTVRDLPIHPDDEPEASE